MNDARIVQQQGRPWLRHREAHAGGPVSLEYTRLTAAHIVSIDQDDRDIVDTVAMRTLRCRPPNAGSGIDAELMRLDIPVRYGRRHWRTPHPACEVTEARWQSRRPAFRLAQTSVPCRHATRCSPWAASARDAALASGCLRQHPERNSYAGDTDSCRRREDMCHAAIAPMMAPARSNGRWAPRARPRCPHGCSNTYPELFKDLPMFPGLDTAHP